MTDDAPAEPVHVCRDCGEEYRADILVCADCGGTVEDRFSAARAIPPPPGTPSAAGADAERADAHLLYASGRINDVVPLTERLRDRELECWMVEQAATKDAPARYALLVRQADASRALAAVADLVAPEHAADFHAVEARFDQQRGYLQCPACGSALASGARECPECALVVGGEEAAQEPGD